ncbi:MAG: CRISPR-associated endoribonuclease Cas6 [Firmicutes bacterium]|nr:CRISPR-associated endoribonuclease Cas6 [Bacillota bacterium]
MSSEHKIETTAILNTLHKTPQSLQTFLEKHFCGKVHRDTTPSLSLVRLLENAKDSSEVCSKLKKNGILLAVSGYLRIPNIYTWSSPSEKGVRSLRILLTLQAEKPIVLPIHHMYMLQGLIYRHLSDPALRALTHDHGFGATYPHMKLFTFSRLMGKVRLSEDKRHFLFEPPVNWVISSASQDWISDLAETLLKTQVLTLADQAVQVSELSFRSWEKRWSHVQIGMLSPLTTYRTEVSESGKRFTHYISPWGQDFLPLIRQNLARKAKALGCDCTPDEVNFTVTPIGDATSEREKILMFKNTPIHGWVGSYRLSGDPFFIRLAYDSGLGGKNSEGFGCFQIYGERR